MVPRKVWKSEEGFGLILLLNVAICHFKFIEEVYKYQIKYISQKIAHFKYEGDS